MLAQSTYVKYLESVVLSLLEERSNPEDDIPITDPTSIMVGFTVSPSNLRQEITEHRATIETDATSPVKNSTGHPTVLKRKEPCP